MVNRTIYFNVFLVFCICTMLLNCQQKISSTPKVQKQQKLQAPAYQLFNVGDIIKGQLVQANQGKGYHMIQVNQAKNKYISLQLMTEGENQFLDIQLYIYRDDEQKYFKKCNGEVDQCYLPAYQLHTPCRLTIVIDCGSVCEYQLKTQWSSIEHIKAGDKVKFMFEKDKFKLYHFQFDKQKQFAEIQFILRPQTKRQIFDQVKIYGKYGQDAIPSAEDYDFVSMHLWLDAEGIYLYKKELKDSRLNLLIVGEAKTIYIFSCEIVNKTIHRLQVGQYHDEYLEPKQIAKYHLNFTQNNKPIEHEQYVFKFAAYSGNTSVQFFIDSEYKAAYADIPYEYMSDSQFIFTREHIKKNLTNGLFVKVTSNERISTYTIALIGRSKQTSIELKEYVYEFIEIQNKTSKSLHFNWYSFQDDEILTENHVFTINLINMRGFHTLNFRICQFDFDKCLLQDSYQNFSQIIEPKRIDEIGAKKTYRIQIPKTMLTNINIFEQKITVLVILKSVNMEDSLSALQFYSDSKYQILRQSHPIESKFKVGENKLYKFTNVDKNIKAVKIHVNKISGLVSIVSFRAEPQNSKGGRQQASNVLKFTQDLLQKSIYLLIYSKEQSIISLDVQLVHIDQQIISSITLQQGIEFKIKIAPFKTQFLELHPIYSSIYFDYKSSGLAAVCQFNNGKCKQQLPEMGVQGSVNIQYFTQKSQIIMVNNPSDNKVIEFTSNYHSYVYNNCENKKIGSIFTQTISNYKCFSFYLTKLQELQIAIKKIDIGIIKPKFFICYMYINAEQLIEGNHYLLKKDLIESKCKKQKQKAVIIEIPYNTTEEKPYQVKFSAQYKDEGAILIPDGVPYQTERIAKQQALEVFYYEVLNNINTTLILTNKMGNADFTVKIAKTVQRHKMIKSTQFDFSSKTANYLHNPALTITAQDFAQAKCIRDCSLVIKIFSKNNVGSSNHFMFEVTQNYFTLEEHKMKKDFLLKGAITFYKFQNKRQGNSILVQISDNNRKCTSIIFGEREYPSDSNNLMIQNGNQLIFENSERKIYFIAIEALQNCNYDISISTTPIHITHLERGKLGYVKLNKDEVKYFMFHRLSMNPFKILSVQVYGKLQFHLNVSQPIQLQKLLQQQKIDYESFKFKGQFNNRLILNKQKDLCQNCYYILACVAKKDTETSVYFGDEDSFLQISDKKQIHDLLPYEGDSLKAYYHEIEDTKLEIRVHSGKLMITMKYFNQTYEKSFIKNNNKYIQEINIKRKREDWSPALIQFIAESDQTFYSVRFITKSSEALSKLIDESNITPGEPNYIIVKKDKVNCLHGYLSDKQEMIMITSDNYYDEGLHKMTIQTTIDGKKVDFIKKSVKNIVSVEFKLTDVQLSKTKKYEVCLNNNQTTFSATVFQTQDISLLPHDIQTIVKGTKVYAIRPDGSFLIDIYQCKGKANISYTQNLKQLSTAKKSSLDILGIAEQPHAFKISEFVTTFIKVETDLAVIRWIPIDTANQTGMGYVFYEIGSLQYKILTDSLIIEWVGLKSKDQTQTKIRSINYTLIFSNTTESLQNAKNCEVNHAYNILNFKIQQALKYTQSLNLIKNYQIQKSILLDKFKQIDNLFFSIVADVDIEPLKGEYQHYRFFYTQQQLSKQLFVDNNQYINSAMNIGFVAAGVLAFLIFTFVCTKKIIPLLGRLKNRLLVEEQQAKDKDKEFDDVPPPSSERNTISLNTGTEGAMNDEIKK